MFEDKPKFKLICMNSYHSFSWFTENIASHNTKINGSGTRKLCHNATKHSACVHTERVVKSGLAAEKRLLIAGEYFDLYFYSKDWELGG